MSSRRTAEKAPQEAGKAAVKRPQKAGEARFSRAQLIACKEFAGLRDPLAAVLAEGGSYTKQEARGLLDEFLKRKV